MENTITRKEHEEFARRQDAENERQNRRIAVLEDNVKEIHGLTVSVERMAVNMENVLTAIERQGNLIEKQNARINLPWHRRIGWITMLKRFAGYGDMAGIWTMDT